MADRDKYGHYVNEKGVTIKVTTDRKGNDHVSFYGSDVDKPHEAAHINIDYGDKTWSSTTHGPDKSDTSTGSGNCYLTTACMKHMKEEFDDNCYELTTLRWFRDNFVSKEDIELYYEVAPIIVENIDKLEDNETIYQYIYANIVDACVKAIEQGDYKFAYRRYKSSVLALNEQFGAKEKEPSFVKKRGSFYSNQAYAF